MTPHLRSVWEVKHILGKKDIETATHYIDNVEVLEFFTFSLSELYRFESYLSLAYSKRVRSPGFGHIETSPS